MPRAGRLAGDDLPSAPPVRAQAAQAAADAASRVGSGRATGRAATCCTRRASWTAGAREVYATLLDERRYLARSARCTGFSRPESARSANGATSSPHPGYAKPELLAKRPNELWSWDITKLLGPAKWTYFYLYVILDVFSRYVVGWMVPHRESAPLARRR